MGSVFADSFRGINIIRKIKITNIFKFTTRLHIIINHVE